MNYRSFFGFAALMAGLSFFTLGTQIWFDAHGSRSAGSMYVLFAISIGLLASLSTQIGWTLKKLKERLDRIEAQQREQRPS